MSRFLIGLSSEQEFAKLQSAVDGGISLQHIVVSRFAHAAKSRQLFKDLAQELIRLAEHAFNVRDISALEETSRVLANLPVAEARQIGQYYRGLADRWNGKTDEALSLLESVAGNAPSVYRARAFQTIGSIYHRQGRLEEALRLYPEALSVSSLVNGRDSLTPLMVHLEVSCIKSEIGDHRGALAAYESLSPLVRIVSRQNPLYFYLYHNELAIELAELGRFAEAEGACAIALASPFAAAYPEWTETRDEIAAKRLTASHSVVAVNRAPEPASSAKAPHSKPRRETEPIRRLAFCVVVNTISFQRTLKRLAVKASLSSNAITQSILDRVLILIAPRAPPTRPLINQQLTRHH